MAEQQAPVIVSPADYKAQAVAASKDEAARLQMDVAAGGGRYLVNGQVVDANGQPVADEKKGKS